MIVGLLEAGHTARKVSEDYGLYEGMIRRWKRESRERSGVFSDKRKLSLTPEEKEIRELRKQLREVELERDIFKKGGEYLLQGRREKYEFMAENCGVFPVEMMCKCLKVSKNSYYSWRRRELAKRNIETKKDILKKHIKEIYDDSKGTYGSPRITAQLIKKNIKISRSYVARLMKSMGLKSILAKKFIVTTDSKHEHRVADNILERDFKVENIGMVWVSDITYVRVGNNWNYLTTIIDLADRKVVGWSLSNDMTAENTVLRAWSLARQRRDIKDGFVFHSDRGVQYACNQTKNIFSFHRKITQSMSRKGNCWDNAVAESFHSVRFKTIKYESLNRQKFDTSEQLYQHIHEYIEEWYNVKRIHSSLGYMTPLEKEIQLKFNLKKAA
ncbi:IS3 family transposase [Chondrinema litorale]|uniref:IS3 family transposase n=1 Tax=Chondrinema litorale TaxID=2994555 RepID=UPI002543D9D7|nr:IS3 family transposase [Chondrinema litorale]UZR99784.1 IS3 family transposase [Chondrinema litorale]